MTFCQSYGKHRCIELLMELQRDLPVVGGVGSSIICHLLVLKYYFQRVFLTHLSMLWVLVLNQLTGSHDSP